MISRFRQRRFPLSIRTGEGVTYVRRADSVGPQRVQATACRAGTDRHRADRGRRGAAGGGVAHDL